MGVYIKGMEMPTSCFYCPFREKVNPDDYVCMALNKEFEETFSLIVGKRHKDCPLVPIPPRGRLIDADALITEFCEWGTRLERGRKLVITMSEAKQAIVDIIEDAPTIIPAEETLKEATNDQNNS